MPVNLSIRNAPDEMVKRLRDRASRHHRSLQGELLAVLEEYVRSEERMSPDDLQLRAELRAVTERRDYLEQLLLEQAQAEKTLRGDLQTAQRTLDRTRNSRTFVLSKYLTEAARSHFAALKLPYRGWRFLFGPGVHERSLRGKLEQRRRKLEQLGGSLEQLKGKLQQLRGTLELLKTSLSKSNEQRTALSGNLRSARKAVTVFPGL